MGARALERVVEARLHRKVWTEDDAADVAVAVRFSRDPGGWTAEIELREPDGSAIGTRTLRTAAPHCSALDEPTALAVALMVDVPREATPARRGPWHYEASLLALGLIGVLPGLGEGARLVAGVRPPGLPLFGLEVTRTLSQDASGHGGGVSLGLQTVGLFVCPLRARRRGLQGTACAGAAVGRIEAVGFGFDQDRKESRPYSGVGARLRGGTRLVGPLELRAGLGAEAVLVQYRFVHQGSGGTREVLYRLSRVSGLVELGLGLEFD
jgi:hypothetical protein